MKRITITFLFFLTILSAVRDVQSQVSSAQGVPCQPSTEEILSIGKSVYDWSPAFEGISVVGEVWSGGVRFKIPEKPLTLMKVLEMVGAGPKTKERTVFLIRQSSSNETKKALEIDVISIIQGLVKDITLEKGDLVFVSRGCFKGRLMHPSKLKFPGPFPPGTDFPVIVRDKRVTR